MYLISVILLLAVLPIVSIVVETALRHGDLLFLIGKWFVFWACGARLFLAGIRQTLNPAFTASTIFEIEDKGVEKIVQELGFGNLSLGLLSLLTIFAPAWIVPAAIAGGLYYGLAGLKHATNSGRNANQNIAMVSDIAIFVVLAGYLIAVAARGGT
jgi:hypothetical protein